MSSSNCRKYLEKSLASLLGYDIGDVEDVIEHLLTFESKEDLLEHLSALLGRDDDEDVISFVNNVDKFQNGERIIVPVDPILSSSSQHESESSKKKKAEEEKRQRQKDQEEKEMQEKLLVQRMKMEQQKELDRIRKEKEEKEQKERTENRNAKQNARRGKNNKSAKTKAQKVKSTSSIPPDSIVMNEGGSSHVEKTTKEKKEKKKKSQPIMPMKGKAKVNCGCFGTIHKPLTNCLNCGRIICTREGYGYCPSCSFPVLECARLEGEAYDKAIMHKERLLEFDRQSASRMQVYDSQADYYSNSRSNWLSENEQLDANRKEEERRKGVHSRKHVLELEL